MSEAPSGQILLVKFRAKAGQEREFAKNMLSYVSGTRTEPGNRQFEFYVDQADALNFMLYEEFADDAALAIHRARPEHGAVLKAIAPMLENPPDVTNWRPALTNRKNGHKPEEVGHVTLVRFRMKADGVERMLNAVGGDLDHMTGNIRFDLNRSQKDPLDAMICARWVGRAVWEAHNARPEF